MSYAPNWFYSSLAQCAAAIVGLLGAILATRLQQQLMAARSSYEDVAKLIRTLRDALRSMVHEIQNFALFAGRGLTAAFDGNANSLTIGQGM